MYPFTERQSRSHLRSYDHKQVNYDGLTQSVLRIDGFESRDETAMLVQKTIVNTAYVLHYNRVKFPNDFFSIVLCTNMAAVTSPENHL